MLNALEIQKRLVELRALMANRGLKSPDPMLWVKTEKYLVYLGDKSNVGGIKGSYFADTPEECLSAAFAAVATLPTGDEASALRYRRSLAVTLEVAREEAISDEFVAPVKKAMDTFTEKLLPDFSGDA